MIICVLLAKVYCYFCGYFFWLRPPCIADADMIFLPCGFFFFFSPRLISADGDWKVYHTSTNGVALVQILDAGLKTCCTQLAEIYRTQKLPKIRHLGSIAQLCRTISSQLRHVWQVEKNLLSSNISSIRPHNMANLWPTSGWDWFGCLGHPSTFQRVSRLGSITAGHSSSAHQPNFAALNRGRHLYVPGRPSRLASAHILFLFSQ